jgi:hypothetical protein
LGENKTEPLVPQVFFEATFFKCTFDDHKGVSQAAAVSTVVVLTRRQLTTLNLRPEQQARENLRSAGSEENKNTIENYLASFGFQDIKELEKIFVH